MAYEFLKLRTPENVVKEMFNKSRLISTPDRQHGKWAETLIQSQREHLYHIHRSL